MEIFQYGDREIEYLKRKDKKLGMAIDSIGHIEREVIPDLFSALVNSIVGQHISTKAHQTIWERMSAKYGGLTPEKMVGSSLEELQSVGISFRKAGYIMQVAEKIMKQELNLAQLSEKTNEEVCKELSALNGVGTWTAEMLLTFSMQRPNVMSYGDAAILKGLCILYHHRNIDRELFEKYKRRYTPYATVASFYLWAVAGGASREAQAEESKFCYTYQTPIGDITMIGEKDAIIGLEFGRVERNGVIQKETALLKKASKELREYFEGKRTQFTVRLNPHGTPFQTTVWEELEDIAYGQTRSYKEVAASIGNPKACRAVGMANNRNPIAIMIPCHRVVGSHGALVGYAGGLAIKEYLLDLEQKVLRNTV